MPVSPRDFELYSRMTGTPMPSDPMSRMQMAPAVYDFTKNFAKKPNLLEKTGNLVKTIGKIGLMGLGQGFKQSQANEQRAIEEQLRAKAEAKQAEALVTGDSGVEVTSEPLTAGERLIDRKMKAKREEAEIDQKTRDDKQAKAIELLQLKKQDLVKSEPKPIGKTPDGQLLYDAADLNSQQPTTADNYQQDFVPNQTSSGLIDRKIEQGSQIADETPNVAEVLSESQDSRQSEFADPEDVQKQMESDMIGGSLGKNQLSKFLKQKGLDQALLGAVGDRTTETPRIGDDSPLLDHPDVIGGEDDSNLPGSQNMVVNGMSTSSTTDLSAHHKEMRKMDAMERNKEAIDEIVEQAPTPSEKQVGSSPNVLAGKDQATFLALTGTPSQQKKIRADQDQSRVEQKTAAKQRMLGMKTPLTDKYYPSDVGRTDIQVGGMVDRKTGLGKSVGISYTPMNGDTKVGFNIMNDPTKPTEVGTFDFVAPPETMQSLQSQKEEDLGSKTFGKLFNMARQKKQGFSGLEM